MTDRPANEIRPGDRVYLSAGEHIGCIVNAIDVRSSYLWTSIGRTEWELDKPLRILQPGYVIPAGATYSYVLSNGSLRNAATASIYGHLVTTGHCVFLSMPTPEQSREEQREKLVKAYWEADRKVVDAVRMFGGAAESLAKFYAEGE